MKEFAKSLIVIVVMAGIGIALFFLASTYLPADPSPAAAPPPLEDTAFTVSGHPTTCSELFRHQCDFNLQYDYDKWGNGLESFVDSGVLGTYAEDIGFVPSAKLSLQACGVAGTDGTTFLNFIDLAHADHPDAGSPQLFPFWNRTRQGLCPST
ncbi:hypothetical protein [Antrihabitans cavernicola]|uniref:Uncharacterized protein n=1 Tax=Antrihabitans cavernicola TaxID=2495913 RepID=A0A5A7S612_9NOCA|nr:hypothetical protein [Spelaeibacter cavernicola]KAA0015875.1 hypothetical protein FOY51_26925 [Spelaeibacter cavernicola]